MPARKRRRFEIKSTLVRCDARLHDAAAVQHVRRASR